jgi:hypothetical protein
MFTKRNGVSVMQYKYLSSSKEYLPEMPEDNDKVPDRNNTSSFKLDYFQSIGGSNELANLADDTILVYSGICT